MDDGTEKIVYQKTDQIFVHFIKQKKAHLKKKNFKNRRYSYVDFVVFI